MYIYMDDHGSSGHTIYAGSMQVYRETRQTRTTKNDEKLSRDGEAEDASSIGHVNHRVGL